MYLVKIVRDNKVYKELECHDFNINKETKTIIGFNKDVETNKECKFIYSYHEIDIEKID